MSLRRAILSLGGGVGTSVALDELNMTPFSMIHIKSDGAGEALADVATALPLLSQGTGTIPAYGNVFKALPGFPMTFGDGTTPVTVVIDSGTGDQGDLEFHDAGVLRWKIRKTLGNGFGFERYDSSGVLQAEEMGFFSTGGVNFLNTVIMKSRTRWDDPVNDTPFVMLDTTTSREFALRLPDPAGFTASRVLTIAMQDANTTLTLNDDATLDQDVSKTGSPQWIDGRFTGNLVVEGTTTTVFSEQVNIADNHFYMNAGYTPAAAQTGGFVVNRGKDIKSDTVAAGGFTAGVASTSNPTVATTGAATFAVGEFIQVSGASDASNDGLYEVLSHAANLLTIRGIGVMGRVEDFTQNQFVTDATVAGDIIKPNITVNRAGTDGLMEQGFGSSTPLAFLDFALLAGQLGGAATAPDVRGIRTTTGPTLLTFGAIADGEFLKRVGATVVGGFSGALDNNFIFSHDTTTQAMSVANTYQGLDFSANEGTFNGWTHTPGTSIFGCNQTGSYDVTVRTKWSKSTGGTASYGVRALFNAAEVTGSMDGEQLAANNQVVGLVTTFSVDGVSGQDLEIEVAGSTTNLSIVPASDPGGATTDVSASINITRRT